MKIETSRELEYTYTMLGELVEHRNKCAQEPAWSPDQRASVVEGIDAHIRKIERDVQEYLAAHPQQQPERIPQPV